MNLTENKNDAAKTVTVAITGAIDTVTSPDLEACLQKYYKQVEKIVLDFTGVDYISSAGLRVLLHGDSEMGGDGHFVIKCPNADIMEILDMTGFSSILTIIKD